MNQEALLNSTIVHPTNSTSLELWLQTFLDPNHSKKNVEDVSQDMEGLSILMREGAWKSAIRLAIKCMMASKSPGEKLNYRLWAILCRIEMRQYESAHSEFRDIGAFDDQKNLTHGPEGIVGSIVPNSMRLLYAVLPCYLPKKDPKLDSLFTLLTFAKHYDTWFDQHELPLLNHTSAQPCQVNPFTDGTEMKTFSNRVIFTIASELCNSGEYAQAIQLISSIVREYPEDMVLLSAIARVYLQIGNTIGANAIFDHVEQFICKKYPGEYCDNNSKQALILLYTNRGYQALSSGAYPQVITCFEQVITLDKYNSMAINNIALGNLYNGNLQKAIKCLEDFVQEDLQQNLRYEATIQNLCTLYDLACHDSSIKKRNLLMLTAPYLSDNFDISVFKIPEIINSPTPIN